MKREIKCPHCGDKWTYKFIIDHEDGLAIYTSTSKFIENWETCTCYNCHKQYMPEFKESNIRMFDFVYKAWRRTKNS